MKKHNTTRDNINLFFSAFLVIAYIVCAYFFVQFANTQAQTNPVLGALIIAVVAIVFGALVFYATRVGENKTVFRFSPATLILIVLPTLYIVAASIITQLPLSQFVDMNGSNNIIPLLSAVALGYGIPYTFISGFENIVEADEVDDVLEGGIEEALIDADEETQEDQEEVADEVVVEGVATEEFEAEETEVTEEATEPEEEVVEVVAETTVETQEDTEE